MTYGGIVQSIRVPDRHGKMANVTLGFPNLADYVTNNTGPGTTYFGAIIGRYDTSGWARLFHLVAQDRLPGALPGEVSAVHVGEVAAWESVVRVAPDRVDGCPDGVHRPHAMPGRGPWIRTADAVNAAQPPYRRPGETLRHHKGTMRSTQIVMLERRAKHPQYA